MEHSATAIHTLLDTLLSRGTGAAEKAAAAIDVPPGAPVETFLERGLHLYGLNHKKVDRVRDRHKCGGARDDRVVAYVLSDALRTDLPKFRQVALDHPLVIQIRALSRADEDLREEANRLTNGLRGQLYWWVPHLLPLSSSADDPWFSELVERAIRREPVRLSRGCEVLSKVVDC